MKKTITAELRVTTPAFIGGADNSQAELRPSTFKGLLRFWFRALYPNNPLREAFIFGTTGEEEEKTGQAVFLLRIKEIDVRKGKYEEWPRRNSSIGYLGYGPLQYCKEKKVRNIREFIKHGSTFNLKFIFKEDKNEYIRPILQSLWLLCHLGGIGSRSRRGFGSLELVSIKGISDNLSDEFKSLTKTQLPDLIKDKIINWSTVTQTNYTGFCPGTRILVLPSKRDWEEALESIGIEMKSFRSQEDLYYHDRNIIRGYIDDEKMQQPPKRSIFGLPHNYHFKDDDRYIEIFPKNDQKSNVGDRRASPLFIHIHRSGDEYIPVISFFPGIFLPNGTKLSVEKLIKDGKATRILHKTEVPAPNDYAPIEEFIKYLIKTKKGAREVIL